MGRGGTRAEKRSELPGARVALSGKIDIFRCNTLLDWRVVLAGCCVSEQATVKPASKVRSASERNGQLRGTAELESLSKRERGLISNFVLTSTVLDSSWGTRSCESVR